MLPSMALWSSTRRSAIPVALPSLLSARSFLLLANLATGRMKCTKGSGTKSVMAAGKSVARPWVTFPIKVHERNVLNTAAGIIGYGHIGSQLSVLAEAMGMSVIYYDVVNLMALGTSRQVPSLEALLSSADFITCHVPELPETKDMIGKEQFRQMKKGSYLINASRGSVVDIPALVDAMRTGKVAGAALDVYPAEPAGNGDNFHNSLNSWAEDLRSLKNIILTPHIGGSTEEAQSAIGVEVGEALIRYVNEGVTLGAVNLPEVNLRSLTLEEPNHVRVIYIHRNVPGVLRRGVFTEQPKVLEHGTNDRSERDSRRSQRRQANDGQQGRCERFPQRNFSLG